MITLIGATGFTGKLVAKELASRNAMVRLAGRDERKLAELSSAIDRQYDCIPFDVSTATSYEEVLEGTNVVINCAGPFLDLGEPVVRETVARGIHYLDTTGEQGFIKLAFDKYGKLAQETGSVLAPASAFEYALGDAAAAMLAGRGRNCESLKILYSVGSPTTSRGTKKSVVRALGSEQLELRNGNLVPLASGKITNVQLPSEGSKDAFPFPGGEALLVPLHLPVHSLETLMAADIPSVLIKFLAFAGSLCAKSLFAEFLFGLIDAGPLAPTEEQTKSTAFSILCLNGIGDSVTVKGRDPYLLTAMIVSDLACHLDSIEKSKTTPGPASPSMVAGYQRIVDITSKAGVTWEHSPLS